MRRGSLARRVLLGQAAVIAVMVATVPLTAFVVGPWIFLDHLRMAGEDDPAIAAHANEAFRAAGGTSLLVGLALAAATSLLVSWLLSRRIGRELEALAAGAERVAQGRYDQPVTVTSAHGEIASLTDSFNQMAAQLGDTEATRRRLLTDLAHELRTPVAAIDVTLEAIDDGVVQPEVATLETLRSQTSRLSRLARDLRAVSTVEEGQLTLERQPTPLAALLRAAALPAPGAHVTLVPPVPDVELDVDGARISQILDNLVRNARQHTPVDGHVGLAARVGDGHAVITVTDDGEGIAAEHLPHVFERFYRADPGRGHAGDEGTGVGLAISRAIAVAHGGRLEAASDGPGHGATFTLTLPVLTKPSRSLGQTRGEAAPA